MSTKMSADLNITRPTSKVSRPPGGASSITFGDEELRSPFKPAAAPKPVEVAEVAPPTPKVVKAAVSGKVGVVIAGYVEPETLSNAIIKALALEGVKGPVITKVNELSVLPYAAQNLAKSVDVVIASAFVTVDPNGAITQSLTTSLLQIGINGKTPIIPAIVSQSSLLEAKALLGGLAKGWASAAVTTLSLHSALEVTVAPDPNLPSPLEHHPDILDVDTLLTLFRESLKEHGAAGIFGIARKFRIIDDDNSGSIDYSEFEKVVKEHAFHWTSAQIKAVFDFFDKDKSGGISYDEFLVGLRGELNERRKQLVLLAFEILDADKSGIVTIEDIQARYNGKKHPDVISGKRTEKDILKEFLETFEVGGEKDGNVTPQQFINYYSNLSASIDDDDYFELMIRNAWHISGGEGWCANTTCRRVLVTHADGRQTVEEIKNDIDIKGDDKEAMLKNLLDQGITDVVSIDLKGSTDSPSQPAAAPEIVASPVKGSAPAGIKAKDLNEFRPSSAPSQFNARRHVGGVSSIVIG